MADQVNFKIGSAANLIEKNTAGEIVKSSFYITNGDDKEYDLYVSDESCILHRIDSLKWGSFTSEK